MSPIQYRNGQQIQNSQANTQISKEIQEIRDTRLGRSARHFSNGYRSTQVFYRELAEQHFLERFERQHTHGPSAFCTLANCRQRPEAHLAHHRWRPLDTFYPRTEVTPGRLGFPTNSQGHRDVDLSTIALNFQHNFGIRPYTHQIHHLLPVAQRLTIQRQQAIAGFQTCGLRRAFRVQLGEHRRQGRTPRANAQRLDRIRLFCAFEPMVQGQFTRRLGGGILLAHHHINSAAFAHTANQLQIDSAPAGGGLAINGNNFLPSDQPGLGRHAVCFNCADDRAHLLAAHHGQDPEEHDCQEEIGDRAGCDNGDTLTNGLTVEGLVQLIYRYLAFTLVEHLDVAAQRNGRNHEFSAPTVVPTQQRHAETDGKAQHLDAATTRDPKVAEFVKGYQHTQSNQGADNHVERTHLISPHSNPVPETQTCPQTNARCGSTTAGPGPWHLYRPRTLHPNHPLPQRAQGSKRPR